MEELISIIVPVYNIGKYLNKCVTSIVNQTYKKLEIILIDDGSTDNSGKICDEWKEKDNRIKVIHKENGGPSKARNYGIEVATGNYLFFVDGDDYIELDIVEKLYKNLIKSNSIISACGHILETYSDKLIRFANNNFVVNSEEALKRLFTGDDLFVVIWGKLYKKELFDTIKFPVGKINEDVAILYRLIDKAGTVSHIAEAGYHYIQRKDSLTHLKYNKDRLTLVPVLEECVKFIKEKYPNLTEYVEWSYTLSLNTCVILTSKNNMKKEYKELKAKLRKNLPEILKNTKILRKTKVKSILNVLGFSKFFVW